MTASTAPITLPARHRIDLPTWRFHLLVTRLTALVVGLPALIEESDDIAEQRLQQWHPAVLLSAVLLILVALAALLMPA